MLQLQRLLLRICLLCFKFSLLVPHFILLVLCNGDGLAYHSVEVRVNSDSNHSPQLRVKATEEGILLLISVNLIRSIARQLRELVQVLHH
jgi:hypothetical protein